MVSKFSKTITRSIKKQIGQFIAMTAIVMMGIAFITGLGAIPLNMNASVDEYFDKVSAPDIFVKLPGGITADQTDSLNNSPYVAAVDKFFCYDTLIDDVNTRIYHMDLQDRGINKLELLPGGRWPEKANEILAERKTEGFIDYAPGDIIDYNGYELEVTGIVLNPLYFCRNKEPGFDFDESKYVSAVFYFDSAYAGIPAITDLYIRVNNADKENIFTKKYKNLIGGAITGLESIGTEENPMVFMTLEKNVSFANFEGNTEKITVIVYIFPVFFVLVAALVVLTTMTRIVEKDRAVIGCCKTLGYSNGRIISKYIIYALIACVTGIVLGFLTGFRTLPAIVYNVYGTVFSLPPLVYGYFYTFGLVASLIMLISLLAVTLYVICRVLKEKPAELLRQKSPKAGKRIFLERIPFIWNRLKFKYKSTVRNIFRYVKHLIMTVVSIGGCSALVFAALGINDSLSSNDVGNIGGGNTIDSLIFVVMILIVLAGALSIVVIYNLTNINIEERKKELATLGVLGYKTIEIAGYIYREIMLLAFFGALVGLPVGYGLIRFILSFMDSPAIPLSLHINWYTWILAVVIIIAFTVVAAFLLYNKIKKIDMNASLKAID